jgi:hypothetical protein
MASEREGENLRHSIYIQIQIVVSQLGFNSNSSKQVSDVKQVSRSQSYQTFSLQKFLFLLLSLAILKYRQYFHMTQKLKLNNRN